MEENTKIVPSAIEKDGKVIGLRIPVINKALYFGEISEKEMEWRDAMAYAEKLGRKLPTLKEAHLMLYYIDEIKAIAKEAGVDFNLWWWTSTESQYSAHYAWIVSNDGYAYSYLKYYEFAAVPLADLDPDA